MLGRAKVFTARLRQGWGGPDVGLHGVISSTQGRQERIERAARIQPLEQASVRGVLRERGHPFYSLRTEMNREAPSHKSTWSLQWGTRWFLIKNSP